MPFAIEIQPAGLRLQFGHPINLLDALRQAGVSVRADCGGEGACGKCVVQILSSNPPPPNTYDRRHLPQSELEQGFRLACKMVVSTSIKIFIPIRSIINGQVLQVEGDHSIVPLQSAVRIIPVACHEANLRDLQSDLARVLQTLPTTISTANLDVVRCLPHILRENNWQVNLWVRDNSIIHTSARTPEKHIGLAVDIGSTKIASFLVDLETGRTLTARGVPNPQIAYGEDIMSRLAYAQKSDEQAFALHQCVIDAINNAAAAMCERFGWTPRDITDACLVGNTAMHHFFLNLPTAALAVSPFVPATSHPHYPSAQDIGIHTMPAAAVYAPPVIAGFVGSDHLAFLLSADFASRNAIRLGIDIGTNTEIALQKGSRIVSVSTASGPAFEGAHIKFGMRAAPGAIEYVTITDDGSVQIEVIGRQQPVGICGSGILDVTAQMRLRGMLNHRGRINRQAAGIKEDQDGKPYLALSNGDQPVTIFQQDIDQILLAKGAIRAGIDILMDYLEIDADDLDEIVIAGAFGSYMRPQHAVGIGMLPNVPLEKIRIAGNAAGTGARLMLKSVPMRRTAERLARTIEYLELTVYPDFPLFYANGIRA